MLYSEYRENEYGFRGSWPSTELEVKRTYRVDMHMKMLGAIKYAEG